MRTENKMAVEPVGKLIWQMSLPPLISMFLQYSYNLIDSAFVAQLSENALTAVSLSFPITTLMNAASIWIGVGVNVLIAGYLGRKEQDKANAAVTHGLLLSFGIGALLTLVSLCMMRPYFRAFTGNEEIYRLSIAYMGVCSFMQIPNMVHIAIQKMIQATGNMVTPMWFQIAGVVVNFVLNPVLIFGIGVFPAMGIVGSASATVSGYLVSMILAFALLLGTKQKVQVKVRGFRLQRRMIGRIFVFGLPSFIMNALSSFMVTIVNLFLVAYSDTAIAFFGAYFKVQQLIVMTVNGLIQGCLPVMRFNYAAGEQGKAAFGLPIRNRFGHRHDGAGDTGRRPPPGADPGIVHGIGSHAFVRNICHADHGGKLPVLWPLHDDLHLFPGHGEGIFEHSDPAVQTVAVSRPRVMVSG